MRLRFFSEDGTKLTGLVISMKHGNIKAYYVVISQLVQYLWLHTNKLPN